jgi:hypothetical protein
MKVVEQWWRELDPHFSLGVAKRNVTEFLLAKQMIFNYKEADDFISKLLGYKIQETLKESEFMRMFCKPILKGAL